MAVATGSYALVAGYYGLVGYVPLDGTSTDSATPVTSPTQLAYGTYGIGIGDFDGDGIDDYVDGGVASGQGATTIEFHKGLGGGTYAAGINTGAGGWSNYVMDFAVADYDRDGVLDFEVNSYYDDLVHVYRGNGDGTFAAMATFSVPFYSIASDSADLNNDGNPDFVVSKYFLYGSCFNNSYCSQTKDVSIFLGDGHGHFTQSNLTLLSNATPAGYPSYWDGSSYWYSWYEDGSWGITLADFDGDGNADLVLDEYLPSSANTRLLFYRGHGDGTFAATPIRTGVLASSASTYEYASLDNADVDGDGIQDVVYAIEGQRTVNTFHGNGDGTFTLLATTSESALSSNMWNTGIATPPGAVAADRRPPDVTLDTLPALTRAASLTVSGHASDAGGLAKVEVLIDGASVAQLAPSTGGVVSGSVTLHADQNAIALRATDKAGNATTTAVQNVVLDQTPPAIALDPIPSLVADAHFTLSAHVTDAYGVASVDAFLDGTKIASPVPAADGAVSVPVTLTAGSHTVSLAASDRAGNSANAGGQIILDVSGPDVALVALPSYTNVATQTITGTANDPDGVAQVQLFVNGAAVGAPFTPDADGTFSVQATLVEGANTIAVVAKDPVGLPGTANVASTLDTVPPTAVLAPLPAYTNIPAINAAGIAKDDASGVANVTIRVVGGAVANPAVAADGSVSATLALSEGPQTIILEVTDVAGNIGATSATLTVDTIPPQVAIVAPLAGQAFGTTQINVAATVSDATPTTLSIGTQDIHLAAGGGIGAGTIDTGAEGPATLPVIARDAAGNVATAQVAVVVDLTAPVADVDFSGVADGAAIGPQPANQLLYTLHVDDLTEVTTHVSWDPSFGYGFSAGGGVLQSAASLVEGTNVLGIDLTDAVGHVTHLARTVTYDVTPPSVSLGGVLATSGAPVRGTIELSADATDNLTGVASGTFDIDGAHVVATAEGASFIGTLDTTTLSDGLHSVHATFVDGVGNTSTADSAILVDNTAPTVAIASPNAGAYLRQTIQVTATASDATSGLGSIAIFVNGAPVGSCPASPCSASFDTSTLANGPFLITATARDAAGNSADAAARTAIADNTAPSKFLVSPITGATLSSSLTVSVNVTDDDFDTVECSVDGGSLGVSHNAQFSATVNLLTKLDGPLVVSCTARDLAGNVGTESATVQIKNWTLALDPRTLTLKSQGGDLTLDVTGPNVALLLPATDKALTLVVPGGTPASLLPKRDGYQVQNGVLELKFDRQALISALKAGIASGSITDNAPVTVRFMAGSRNLGSDVIKVQK